MSVHRSKVIQFLMLGAVLPAGYAFRLVELARIDLGMDGGLALAMAVLGPGTVFDVSARDVHPPLYYLLLSLWVALAGPTLFAAKFLSVLFAVLSIPLLFALGRKLGRAQTGLIAAALVAVSPIWIMNTAALRDFVPAACFALLSTFAFLKALDVDDRQMGARAPHVTFLVATVAALLTSYLSVGVLAAQLLYALLRSATRRRWRLWLKLTLLATAAFGTWLWFPLTTTVAAKASTLAGAQPTARDTASFVNMLSDALRHLTSGEFLTFSPWPIALSYVGVLACGLAVALRAIGRRSVLRIPPRGELCLAFVLAISLAIDYAIVRFWLHDSLPSRYLVIASPFFLLLVARALDAVADWRWPAAALACFALLLGGTLGLRDFYARPALPLSSWDPAGTVRYVDERAVDSEGIVFTNMEQAGYYSGLTKRQLRWYVVNTGPKYLEGELAESIRQVLPAASAANDALWLVLYMNAYASNAGDIRDWLDSRAYRSTDEWISDGVMLRYATPKGKLRQFTTRANYGNLIQLRNVSLDDLVAAPGDVRVELDWQAIASVPQDYTVFVHLVDDKGKLWGQFDGVPRQPTSRWQTGETFSDRRAVQVAPGVPTGMYWLEVGLYRGEQRLDLVTGGNFVKIGPIQVR